MPSAEEVRTQAAREPGLLDWMAVLKARFQARLIWFRCDAFEVGSQRYRESAVAYVATPNQKAASDEWRRIKKTAQQAGAIARGRAPRGLHSKVGGGVPVP